ncbi:MAG TPA: hypothetical protein VMT46_09245 [Anaerolineaceae bacterium]|nr:hypothetical protein [Anaerolineaceae bacterium]
MKRRIIIPIIAVGVLAVGAFLGVGAVRSVFAQTASPTTSAPAQPNGPALPGFDRGKHGPGPGGVSDADLAAALGITTDQLSAAYRTANTEALKDAVAQGLITQAQADQMAQNGERFHGMPGSTIDDHALLAKALGISTDQLNSARQKALASSLATAVQNGTLTQAQADLIQGRSALYSNSRFQDSMKSAFQTAVQQAVTDGVITQAQADQLLKDQPAMGGFPGYDFGGPGDRHGFGGPGFAPNGSNGTPNVTPTTTPSSSGSQG